MAAPHPTLKACLSAHRGVVHGAEKSEAAGLRELVSGNLTCPFSPPCPGWTWGVLLSGPPLEPTATLPSALPQTFLAIWLFHPGQSSKTVGVPTPSALGSPDMQSLWQAASGRPGQGTERRGRRRAAADQTRDKSQLRSKQSGSGVGAPAGRASPDWLALEEAGRCLLSLA